MYFLILFLLSLSLFSAPTISNNATSDPTPYSIRIAWTASVASTNNRVLIDTFDPPTTSTVIVAGSATTIVYTVTGLTPATTYYWIVCSTNSGETCTTSASFTTSAEPSGQVTSPTAPTSFSTTFPTIDGSTFNVASNCSDLQTQIDLAADEDGSLNHAVVIPAGTECVGRYVMTAKTGANPTGAGFIVLMSGGTLPPAGSRTSPTLAAGAAAIISNYFYSYYQNSAPGTCRAGEVWFDTDSGTFPVNYCVATNTWAARSFTSGAGAPAASCVEDAWYKDTSEPDQHKAYWWCTRTNKFRNLYVDNNIGTYTLWAGLYSTGNTKGYRVTGLKIQDVERSAALTSLLATASGSGDEIGSKSFCLVYTTPTDSYIFFDRVWFWGQGEPHRQQEAWCFAEGTYLLSLGNYFDEINTWRPIGAGETATHAIFFRGNVGPMIIKNNYFGNVSGMGVFASDDDPEGVMSDISILNNEFFMSPTLNLAEATSNGKLYYFRHHIEAKSGVRWLIEGNTLTGGFPSGNPNGAAIGLTPTNGASSAAQCRTNTRIISDFEIRYNKLLYNPMGVLYTGLSVTGGGQCQTFVSRRVAFRHNVIWESGNSSTGNTDGPTIYGFNGQAIETGNGWQDFEFSNNLHFDMTTDGSNAHMFNFGGDWSPANSRFRGNNNIYYSPFIGYQWSLGSSGSGVYGTSILNTKVVPNTTWYWTGNARQRGQTSGLDNNPAFPAGNYSSQTYGDFNGSFYQCTACGDEAAFRPLYNSKFVAASTTARGADRRTNGPNFRLLTAATGDSTNVRSFTIADTTASIGYLAPDSNACTVEYGTSATPLTGARVSDNGGIRTRVVNLTGLTTGTTYYYRVFCRKMSSGTFNTL